MRRLSARGTARRNVAVVVALVVVVFLAALAIWTRSSGSDSASPAVTPGPGTSAFGSTAPPADPASSPGAGGSSGSSSGTAASAGPSSAAPALPDLPESTDVDVDALPQHAISIAVTSDEPIAFVGYRVAYGHPGSRTYKWATSPVRVQTVGRGTSQVVAVIAQAGPYATRLTCSVSVDGRVRSTQTVDSAYRVVYCGA